jgi:hypothetical protein
MIFLALECRYAQCGWFPSAQLSVAGDLSALYRSQMECAGQRAGRQQCVVGEG